MHFANILTIAALAFGAISALPNPEPNLEPDTGSVTLLEARTHSCKGDMWYNGWKGVCECDKGEQYDGKVNKCKPPPFPKPFPGKGYKCYCAKSSKDYCEYDPHDDRCNNDGASKLFCCKPEDVKKRAKEECPKEPQQCDKNEKWNWGTQKCECEPGMQKNDKGKCDYPPLPKPQCEKNKKPYCAKDKDDYCPYDEKKGWCKDDGKNICFCSKPNKTDDYCKQHWLP